VQRNSILFACFLAILVAGLVAPQEMHARPNSEQQPGQSAVWQPPSGLKQVPIWPGVAPDTLPGAKPETVRADWPRIENVSRPTMTVYPPKGHNRGVAAVVFPGGGFQFLAMDLEGTEICDWLSAKGMTCILSKYRVPNSNHHWDERCRCAVTPKVPLALQDAQRTIRLVRSQARALAIDPHKIGVIGFSAGGYLVAQVSNILTPAYKSVDELDRINSRPDFAIALYPGHLCRPGAKLDPGIRVTKRTPPTFLLQAWDDPVDEVCNTTVYARALDDAGVPTEVHLFTKGGHAFGLRHEEDPVGKWPSLVEDWLKEIGVL
jgi:acetyl esterase/lipase